MQVLSLSPKYSFEKDGISQSLLSNYLSCPKRFAINTHELSGPSKFAMEIGTYGHKMIETDMKAFSTHKMDKIVTTEEREQCKAYLSAIMPAYFAHYKTDKVKFTATPEHVFDVKIAGVRFRGKIDNIFTDKKLQLSLKETKFKSRISETDLDTCLALDFQSLMYLAAITLERRKSPKEVIYDVVRYPTMKPGMLPMDIHDAVKKDVKKDPARWFYRWHTKFNELEIMHFIGELTQIVLELKERKVWYRNTSACNKGFKCDYINLCKTGDTAGLLKRKLFSELEN